MYHLWPDTFNESRRVGRHGDARTGWTGAGHLRKNTPHTYILWFMAQRISMCLLSFVTTTRRQAYHTSIPAVSFQLPYLSFSLSCLHCCLTIFISRVAVSFCVLDNCAQLDLCTPAPLNVSDMQILIIQLGFRPRRQQGLTRDKHALFPYSLWFGCGHCEWGKQITNHQ